MECNKIFNWRNFLTQHPIFSSLSKREIDWLICDNVSYEYERSEGYEIIREGEISHSIYLIGSGSVQIILKAEEGSEIKLATLKKGEFFGEIAAIQKNKDPLL
jgi:CRP-like cAMP-binding protein